MVDRKSHSLYYNCDEKWVPSHKFQEKKLFEMDAPSPSTLEESIIK